MNLPNLLSLFRILAVPVFLVLVLPQDFFTVETSETMAACRAAALVLVILVTVTDWLDGYIARTWKLVTPAGKLLDPLAHKIFVTAALVALVRVEMIPVWAAVVVISREFLVTGLRGVAVEYGRVIEADRLGKHKTGWQLALIITAMVLLTARDFFTMLGVWEAPLLSDYGADTVWFVLIWIPLTVTILLTVASGAKYVIEHHDLLRLR